MIMNAFPRTQGTLSRESYLTLLLLALIRQAGGEIHIASQSLEELDSGGTLLIDWDMAAQQCVLRGGSAALVVAPVRGTGWTAKTTSPESPNPEKAKHRVMSEEQILQDVAKRVRSENLRQWRESGAAAVAGMPEPEDSPQ